MTNISFANPYLFLLIPILLLAILIPFWIAIRKENSSKSTTASLILHVLIVLCVVFALVGTMMTTVITKTMVWVVADVSYSSDRNLEQIDAYVAELQTKLPPNTELGVICFGRDAVIVAPMGSEHIPSVREAALDNSATDIASALNYAATLFPEDVIKRIVLITDGKETECRDPSALIRSIEQLASDHVKLDAIYLDNNLTDTSSEVQLEGVEFTPSAYLHHKSYANALLRSVQDTNAVVTLMRGDEQLAQKAVRLTRGYNVVSFALPTSAEGTYDYELVVEAEADASPHNNRYGFTQAVNGKLQVLLISSQEADLERARALYGEHAVIDAYIRESAVPCNVEDLCKYDEIVLSGVDLRQLDNYTAFIQAVDTVVSVFGKSLVTMGDLNMQSKDDEGLRMLGQILPVQFGNDARDPKLYTIVIDASRSMEQAGRLITAKKAAIQLLELLDEEDHVMIVSFWGEISIVQHPAKLDNKAEVADKINQIKPRQGTVIGAALRTAGEFMEQLPYEEKQIMLISDGMSYALESDTPTEIATDLAARGIYTSTINPFTPEGADSLEAIAKNGGGVYYHLVREDKLDDLMFTDIAGDVTESVIEKQSAVNALLKNDSVLDGVHTIPDVYGYAFAKVKASATTVLTVDYQKNEKTTVQAPLYAYWKYGNGRVATLTTALLGTWSRAWTDAGSELLLKNVLLTNTPTARIDYPYTLSVQNSGMTSSLELIPAVLNPYATADMEITLPDGTVIAERLSFDSSKYFYPFETSQIGKYQIRITYAYGQKSYTASTTFYIPFAAEYEAFTFFSPSNLYAAVRNRGNVHEGTVPTLVNDEAEVATYTVSFTVPLLIAATSLFIIDLIVRKLQWKDIRSLFSRRAKKGGKPA